MTSSNPMSGARTRPADSLAAQRGRIGAYRLHATHDPRVTTEAGRRAFLSSFERGVDPAGTLDPAERHRRAEAAKKAHFVALAYKSSLARRRKGRPDVDQDASGPTVSAQRGSIEATR